MSARRVLGAILAGGRAERLGGAFKPLLELDGEALVARVARAMHEAFGVETTIIVAVNDALQDERIAALLATTGIRFDLVRDVVAGGGPLSGLVSCLEAARTLGATDLVVVAADMPRVPSAWIGRLAESRPEARALLTVGRRREPLCARYAVSLADLGRSRLAGSNRSMLGFADAAGAETMVFDVGADGALSDVDTPDDAARLGIDVGSTARET